MSINDTQTKKLNLRPGIDKNTTELDAEGTYVSCDKIRFFYGKPQKLGGWQSEQVNGTIEGVARSTHTFVDLEETSYLGIGTSKKLYLFSQGDLSDVTPINTSASVTDVLNTQSGSDVVTVSIAPGDSKATDYFIFAEVTASLATVNFTSSYQILSAGAGHFTFLASSTADSTIANGGGGVHVDFLLPGGLADNGAAGGWGAGTWGTPGVSVCAGWSDPRTSAESEAGVSVNLRQWSLDNWGEDYLGNPRGGKIYRWDATNGVGVRAELMASAAPSVVNQMLVAQEGRHVIAFGTHNVSGDYDPLLIRWSDSENLAVWDVAATNQAGEFRLENGSFIIGAQESRREIIVFTDESVYSMSRVGGQAIFSFSDLGRHNGLVSQNGAVDVNGKVYWMGYSSFHKYDGVIQTMPCTLQNYLFDAASEGSLNFAQRDKVVAKTNREFNEIWWFYPSRDSTENDKYVVHNYLEDTWYNGTIERTTWADVDIFAKPYAIDASGTLYIHEQGKNDDAGNLKATLKTSNFDLDDGGDLMFLDRYIPDNEVVKEYNVGFTYKKYPQSVECFDKGPYAITPTTTKVQPRIRGRQCQLRYSTSIQGSDFRIGTDRLDLKTDGKR